MATGKTIELLLRDGTFFGIVEASIGGHTIKGFKVGRDDSEINAVPELANPGVYFLFVGPTNDVYIGESQNIQKRLKDHKRDYNSGKETFFWTEALCFIEPSLAIVTKYCEDRLIEDAENLKNYNVLTKASGAPKVSPGIKVNMENFIENVETLVGTFGKTVYIGVSPSASSSTSSSSASAPTSVVYTYKKAKMIIDKRGFVVLANSEIEPTIAASCPKSIAKLRKDLMKSGVIDASFKLTKNYPFDSVSSAAKFVAGYSTKGTGDWKDPSGVPIGKIKI